MDEKERQAEYTRVVMVCQPNTKEMLDEMCEQDHRTMSMFLNVLVMDEYNRRNQK